jgi:Mn2+/Fe2+ NRAMP family transporter
VLLLVLSAGILAIGRYPALDTLIKVIVFVLAVSSIAAVVMALFKHNPGSMIHAGTPVLWDVAGVSFLVALIGWMPSAIDISVWHSLWTLERAKQTAHNPSVREALIDFNIGYIGTAVIALFFLALGALVMHGSGEQFQSGGAEFAGQLVALYTSTLGDWSRPIILIAAFTAMFSTTLTCADAFPRVLRRLTAIVLPNSTSVQDEPGWLYWMWMSLVIAGALLLLTALKGGLTLMVDIATTLSFLTAPVLGYLNLRVVTSHQMPPSAVPGRWMRLLSWAGIIFGITLGVIYVVWRLL